MINKWVQKAEEIMDSVWIIKDGKRVYINESIEYLDQYLGKFVEDVLSEEAKLEDIVDVNILKKQSQEAYDEVVNNFEDYTIEPNRAVYRIETLGSGSTGIHLPEQLIKAFKIPVSDIDKKNMEEDNSIAWEIVEDFFNPISEQIKKEISIDFKEGFENYQFYFGSDENDGDFCLFIQVEKS